MDNKPSLSQYFSESEVPNASQFFDEIGTSPSEMIQSVYLGEPKDQTGATDLFSQSMTASFAKCNVPQEMSFSDVVPTVSGASALPATSLPDPSTFFDTIGSEPQLGPAKSGLVNPNLITEAVDGLSIKNQPLDKEADRRRDAWIPCEEAQKTLIKAQSSPKGSFFPEREVLTMPGLILEEELPDALHEIAVKYLGVSSAGIRGVVRADHVTKDEAGLRELIRTGHLRAAINLSGTLLGAAGQGAGRMNRPSKHSPRSLQLWLTRFAIMVRLRLQEALLREADAFAHAQRPDMYYQFYPDNYEHRTGSLVPFSLRLLLAELPSHVGKPEEAIDRLQAMLAVIEKMLSNLKDGKTEDGSCELTDEQDRGESVKLWTGRAIRVKHSIINCAIAMKDYRLAASMVTSLAATSTSPAMSRSLHSALSRLWLLAGHVPRAALCCQQATHYRNIICPTPDVREYVDLGLIDIANGKYQEAYNNLAKAADQEPTNIMVANNISVCLLYMGRLKEAIMVLQKAIQSDPERGLNDSLLINLCTLYELESSKNMEKKLELLRMICKYKSDTIPNVSECLKLS